MAKNKALLNGLDIYKERVTEKGVVDAVGMDYEQPQL
jgi:alanine dehydrogenase